MSRYNKKTKVWSGPKVPPLYNPDQALGQLILRVLELTPNVVTQISADTGVELTCGEMRERTLKIAAHLRSFGLKQGDVIGFVAGNSDNLAPTVFACFLLGLPVHPLAPVMIESDIVQMYSKTKPRLIFCDADRVKVVQNALDLMKSDAKIFTMMDTVDGYDSAVEMLSQPGLIDDGSYPDVDPNSTAMILCSSGSTGFPKGIQKSHKQFLNGFRPMPAFPSDGPVVSFLFSPIFWFSGAYLMLFGTLFHFRRIITCEPFTPERTVEIVNKHRVTFTFTPPYALVSLLQLKDLQPLESIRTWNCGGSLVSKELCDKFRPFIPNGELLIGYGSTEQGIATVTKVISKLSSAGDANDNVRIKIVDENGYALDSGQCGEIYLQSQTSFIAYFGEPEKTVEAFDGEWFKTGDVGYFDDEGYLYIVGRKKELLKFNNYQVTPSELEAIINEIEGVACSCVVGVLQEETGNDIIHAFVIVEESSKLSEQFVLNYVNERVFDAKKLRGGVHFVKSFELGLTGKVDRIKMRKIAENMTQKTLEIV